VLFVQGDQFGQALPRLGIGDLLVHDEATQIGEQLLIEFGPVCGALIGAGACVPPRLATRRRTMRIRWSVAASRQ